MKLCYLFLDFLSFTLFLINDIVYCIFSRVAKEGFLKELFDDLKKDDDVLVQLNAIEIVSNLAESKQGFEYLHSLEILTQMDTRLNQVSSG